MPHLWGILATAVVTVNATKATTLFPPGYATTEAEIASPAGYSVGVTAANWVVVVGVPVGSNGFVESHALKVVREERVGHLVWLLVHMPQSRQLCWLRREPPARRPTTSREAWMRAFCE